MDRPYPHVLSSVIPADAGIHPVAGESHNSLSTPIPEIPHVLSSVIPADAGIHPVAGESHNSLSTPPPNPPHAPTERPHVPTERPRVPTQIPRAGGGRSAADAVIPSVARNLKNATDS